MTKNTNDELLTLEKLTEILKGIFENQPDKYDNPTFPFPVGYVGNGMYHIGNGTMTGKKGWIDFNELLKEEAESLICKEHSRNVKTKSTKNG